MSTTHPVSLIGGPRSGTVEYVEEPWPRYGYVFVDDGEPGTGTAKYDLHKVSSDPDVWEGVWIDPGQENYDDEQSTEGEPGPTGPAGAPGPAGPEGPPGEDGTSFLNRGAWSASVPYSPGDVVSYQGSSWSIHTDIIGTAPHVSGPWRLMASKGDTGATGATGPAGPTGPEGPEGPEGPPGEGGGGGGLTWRGVWDVDVDYVVDDIVIVVDGGTWVAVADNSGVEPGAGGGPPAPRTSYVYVFGNQAFASTPVLQAGVAFTDFSSAAWTNNNLWISGSRVVSFDADAGSTVTVACNVGVVGYRDTGAPGSGNSEVGGHDAHSSPWTFTMPAEGRMTLEIASGMTTLTVSGPGVQHGPGPAAWELFAA